LEATVLGGQNNGKQKKVIRRVVPKIGQHCYGKRKISGGMTTPILMLKKKKQARRYSNPSEKGWEATHGIDRRQAFVAQWCEGGSGRAVRAVNNPKRQKGAGRGAQLKNQRANHEQKLENGVSWGAKTGSNLQKRKGKQRAT